MKIINVNISIRPVKTEPIQSTNLVGGLEFFNKTIRKTLNEFFCFVEGDQIVEVLFYNESHPNWSDECPDEVAAALGHPNVPVEDDGYCSNLRFPSYLPRRVLGIFEGLGNYNVGNANITINISAKQSPFKNIKSYDAMLEHITV